MCSNDTTKVMIFNQAAQNLLQLKEQRQMVGSLPVTEKEIQSIDLLKQIKLRHIKLSPTVEEEEKDLESLSD